MLFDMFDKLDDIIYKPIETCCEWTKEPLKRWKHEREQQAEHNRVENEIYRQQQEMQLAQWDAEKRMELEQAQARANIELEAVYKVLDIRCDKWYDNQKHAKRE